MKFSSNIMSKDEEHEEPVSPTGRLMNTPNFNITIIIIFGFKTKIDPNLFKKCLQQTLLKHPRFSSVLVTRNGKSRWKRSGRVDLENHVFVPDVDPTMGISDEFVEDFATSVSETPMDMTKPLWESYILNVKTSDANSVVIGKLHHSMGDGVSLVALMDACARKLNDPNSLPEFPTSKKEKKGGSSRGVVVRFFALIWTVMLVVFYTLMDVTGYLGTLTFMRDTRTPIKAERGVAPSRRRFVHRIVSLGDVKLVKNAMNVSVNDVILGITEAGVSRYLSTIYEVKNKENGKEVVNNRTNSLPRNLGVRSTVVSNLRPSPTIENLSEMMEKEELNGLWGNLIGIVLLPFTINMQDEPLTYIRRAKSIMDRKKLSHGHRCAFDMMKLMMLLFGAKVAARMTMAVFRNTTLTFSNVIGPKEEVSLFGHHLSYIAPSVYGFPQALVIHYQSYADKLVISIGADEKLVPDPHQLCDDLIKSLENMKEAVIKRDIV